MKALLLREIASFALNPTPLSLQDVPDPILGLGEVLIRVTACGVCHTELDEIEGRTPPPHLPVVLGHQVVGVVEEVDNQGQNELTGVRVIKVGQRVGVAWISGHRFFAVFFEKPGQKSLPRMADQHRTTQGMEPPGMGQ